MSARPRVKPPPIPRLALKVPSEASAALGVSDEFFSAHIKPGLKLIRKGSLVLVLVSELERWGRENGSKTLE